MGEQDDIDVLAFLSQIGDSRNVFITDGLFEEEDEMLIADVGYADRSCLLVVLGELYKASGNVFQPFFGIFIVT